MHGNIYIWLYCSSFCRGVNQPPGNLATIVINDSHYLISSAHIERSSSNSTDDEASYVASISQDYMISGMLVDSIFYIVSDVTGLSAAQFTGSIRPSFSQEPSWFPWISRISRFTIHHHQTSTKHGSGLDIQIRSPRIALVGALELILLSLLVMKASGGHSLGLGS